MQQQFLVPEMFTRRSAVSPAEKAAKKLKLDEQPDLNNNQEDPIEEDGAVDSGGIDTKPNPTIISLAEYVNSSSTTASSVSTGPGSIWLYGISKSLSKTDDLSSPLFDPAVVELAAGPCSYGLISNALELIENLKASGSGSRKKTIIVLANLFRVFILQYPSELVHAIYLIINQLAPDYENVELGVGDQIVMRAMGEAYGRTEHELKALLERGDVADLGEAALQSRVKQSMLMEPPKLTVGKVFKELRAMADATGKNSQQFRRDAIKKLLVSARDKEPKFIVRTLQSKLRIGIQHASVIQALADAIVLTHKDENGGMVSDLRSSVGGVKSALVESRMVEMEDAVRQAFCEMPNYEKIVHALQTHADAKFLASQCHVTPLIPMKPMLAKPTRSVHEVLDRFTGIQFTAEYKYDGERAQIHIDKAGAVIDVFSRNSEHMTEKYPDVVSTLKQMLAEVNANGVVHIQSAIIDAEVVAYNTEEDKLLSFQILSTRARKNVKTEDIKVSVCLFPFDLVYLNGDSLVKRPLRFRRDLLRSTVPEIPGKLQFAVGRDLSSAEEVETFLGEAVDHMCEGLMIKTLDENASYEPSKRSLNWLKLKKDYVDGLGDSVDLVPIGGYRGKGKRSGVYGAFLLAVFDQSNGEFQSVCKIGTGFSDEDLQQHWAFFKDHIIDAKRMDYDVHESLFPDDWFDAVQVWEVAAADLSISPIHSGCCTLREDGKGIGLRFPRFERIRPDKAPEDATNSEQILQMYEDQFRGKQKHGEQAGGGDEDDNEYDL